MKLWMVLLIILVILVAALVVLYFLGKRAEKKQAEQKEQLDAVAQTLNMLIIDKKKLRIKNAKVPKVVQGSGRKSQGRAARHDTDV